jgi:hypothetical protein
MTDTKRTDDRPIVGFQGAPSFYPLVARLINPETSKKAIEAAHVEANREDSDRRRIAIYDAMELRDAHAEALRVDAILTEAHINVLHAEAIAEDAERTKAKCAAILEQIKAEDRANVAAYDNPGQITEAERIAPRTLADRARDAAEDDPETSEREARADYVRRLEAEEISEDDLAAAAAFMDKLTAADVREQSDMEE